jgi:uncharacterized protein (DUF2345 family)
MSLSDYENINKISISQSSQKENITLHSKQGGMDLEAHTLMFFSAGKELYQQAKESFRIWIDKRASIDSNEGCISFDSKTIISMHSKNYLQIKARQQLLTADDQIKFNSKEQISFSANGSLVLSSLHSSQFWQAGGGKIHITARNNILLNGSGSKMKISYTNISLQTAGIISLNALAIGGI